jgi:putative DNA methylase
MHLWWARRPLAACRAVLFASLVDDPSSRPEEFPTEEAQEKERERLFRIIEELVKWENSNNQDVLAAARTEIMKATDGNPPPFLDPFCGGGSIPLEAQRLGLDAHGRDLNPVAVLITKALIEIPPKFANRPPVNPDARKKLTHSAKWAGAQGLADDVRYYGTWIRDEAEKRIGHLYPTVEVANGREATVIAWLWARTVKCPNPACGVEVPLVRSFAVSTKKGKERSILPTVHSKRIQFAIVDGPPLTRGTVIRTGIRCLACEKTSGLDYVRAEGQGGRLSSQLMAIVAEGDRSRIYVAPTADQIEAANVAAPDGVPDTPLPTQALGFRVQAYGMRRHRDLFSARQLVSLTTFSDLIREARNEVLTHALMLMSDSAAGLADGGDGARAYADAVVTYLAFALDKMADRGSTICTWFTERDSTRNTFARQTLQMTWDYAELNPLLRGTGSFEGAVQWTAESLDSVPAGGVGVVDQRDSAASVEGSWLVSTDPPYYDNIGYADLSDFFYVWLRRSLKEVFPSLFSTVLVPKAQELVAEPFRHNGAASAAAFFERGMMNVFNGLSVIQDVRFPMTVFYAFKQAEDDESFDSARASTGWETMLEGILSSGWSIVGTWPSRSELSNRMRGQASNALASSIVLVCRVRPIAAPIATRREFIVALKSELPSALKKLQHSNIAAVDLAQAAIGPGMAVYSRYAKVIEADGSSMRVRSALQLINQALDEVLSEQESEYDADTQWAVAWFDQFGTSEAPFGEAETLSKAKNTSVGGLVESGLLRAAKGKVQLVAREQLDADWDPTTDRRLTIWEVTQHLIARVKSGGEQAAADLLRKVGGMGEIARDLAYRLYSVCERKGWTEEAIAYNSLVVAWPEITRAAAEGGPEGDDEAGGQASLL